MTETVGAYWTKREEEEKKMRSNTPVAMTVHMADGSERTVKPGNGWEKEIEFLLGIWDEPGPQETERAWRLVNGKWPESFVAISRATLKKLKGKVSAAALGILAAVHFEADFRNGKYAFSITKMAREWGWDWVQIRNARDELEKLLCISVEDRGRRRVSPVTILRNDLHGLTTKDYTVKPCSLPRTSEDQDFKNTSAIPHTPRKEKRPATPCGGKRPGPSHEERRSVNEGMDPEEVDFCRSELLDLVRDEKTGKRRKPYAHEKKLVEGFIRTVPVDRIFHVICYARTRKKPFGAAIHALRKGYPVGPPNFPLRGNKRSRWSSDSWEPPAKKDDAEAPLFCSKCANLEYVCFCPDPVPERVLLSGLTPFLQRRWEGVSLP